MRIELFILLLAFAASVGHCEELVSIVFEGDSVAPADAPGDGWKIFSPNGNDRASIGSTGRTFQTGTAENDEALFIKPYTPGADDGFSGSLKDSQGVQFTTDTPIALPEDAYVYIITETFSDMAFAANKIKIRLAAGIGGDGDGFLQFDSFAGGETLAHEISYDTTGRDRQLGSRGRDIDGSSKWVYFPDSLFEAPTTFGDENNNPADPSANFLDRTYVSTTLYRPDVDADAVFSEARVSDGTSVASYEGTTDSGEVPTDNLPLYGTEEIDRLVVAIARHNGFFDGPGGEVDEETQFTELPTAYVSTANLSAAPQEDDEYTIDNAADLKIGIKSLRIGFAERNDFNLDGVIDGRDINLLKGNMGMTESTFFDGDYDDDGDVDADDLAAAVTPFDCSGDGDVTDADVACATADTIGATLATISKMPGDIDLNGEVDFADFLVLSGNFGKTIEGGHGVGDLDVNGIVEFGDFLLLSGNFGMSSAAATVVVPEPQSCVLIFIASLLATRLRKRR